MKADIWATGLTLNQCGRQNFFQDAASAPIGGHQAILEVNVSPRHALLNLIIVLHYLWVPPPLKSWHAAGLADNPPSCSTHLRGGHTSPECKAPSLQLPKLCLLLLFHCYTYSLLIPKTIFYLKLWQLSHLYTSAPSSSIFSPFSHNPLSRFRKLEEARNRGEKERVPLDTITNFFVKNKKNPRVIWNASRSKGRSGEHKWKICHVSHFASDSRKSFGSDLRNGEVFPVHDKGFVWQ